MAKSQHPKVKVRNHLPRQHTWQSLRRDILENLLCRQGKFPAVAGPLDYYMALAYAVRDRLQHRWIETASTYFKAASRTVICLSAEYLIGPQLCHHLLCLGLMKEAERAVRSLGFELQDLARLEEEPGLGHGGLGRLAACTMESMATLQIPSIAYGIRYEFGIFDQEIRDGWQVEATDKWLRYGNPWEIAHPEIRYDVKLGGRTESRFDEDGKYRVRWVPARIVQGTAHDMPVPGYRILTTNLLRLWRAEAAEAFNFQAFNVGDYYGAVQEKIFSENITKVLYPNDKPPEGKILRLEQQYFFVSCSLQDMIRIYLQRRRTLDRFHQKYTIQLNDTHPAIAVAELMRLLVDEHNLPWEHAWDIVTRTFAYTNHTLLPEALETWPAHLFAELLPRHMEIILEINRRFLQEVRLKWPGDENRTRRMSIIDETGDSRVRMANLACVGSRKINGVAKLHAELLKRTVLRDFWEMWPDKFTAKTNGVNHRRFLGLINPPISELISRAIGSKWIKHSEELTRLESFVADQSFLGKWRQARRKNKVRLAEHARRVTGVCLDPDALFDVQVKRIHEYKRQHLNILRVIGDYLRLRSDPNLEYAPRAVIFGGKAAPGYFMAKLIIRLIHGVAEIVNADRSLCDRLKVVFLPDFNVSNAQLIYPAADLSEQISLAGTEASGTGNMKFMMNGAVTIGTLDGANIEILEELGTENFFAFGLSAPEAAAIKTAGYNPRAIYDSDPELHSILDAIAQGMFSNGDKELFRPLVEASLNTDQYLALADYRSYTAAQRKVEKTWSNAAKWTRMSVLNSARSGRFSSDRMVREYNRDIWKAPPVRVSISPLGWE